MFAVAYYKATRPGLPGAYNWLVRQYESGPYSHCELIFSDGVSGSASFSDGGVRYAGDGMDVPKIDFASGHWDVIELPDYLEGAARIWFDKHRGKSYDLRGNLRFLWPFGNRDSKDKWFCDEAILASLGVPDAWRFGVNTSFVICKLLAAGIRPALLKGPE